MKILCNVEKILPKFSYKISLNLPVGIPVINYNQRNNDASGSDSISIGAATWSGPIVPAPDGKHQEGERHM